MFIPQIFSNFSVFHLNILLLLGLALFGGILGGRLFQKLRVPQVVGYIIIGIIIGESGLGIVSNETLSVMTPLNYFALGIIGFLVGGELKREIFKKYGKHFLYILLCEGISPFLLVSLFTGIVGMLLYGAQPFVWALAILMGAIASATDPASTTLVLKEYKTRGPITTTILGIVALDDGLALLLFAIASSIAGAIMGNASGGFWEAIFHPLYEILGAVGIGVVAGYVLIKILKRYAEKERILAFSVGMVLLVTGLAITTKVSMLLAAMTLGLYVVNTIPHKSREAFQLVEGFSPPIYVLFFVMVGAKLQFSHMTLTIIALVATYLIFGLSGKMLGAYVGAVFSNAGETVRKYLPFSLYSQAGVAIGLSILASQYFPGEIGNTLMIIITATTFVTQLLGPPFTKLAVTKAGEVGLNITEEDIIQKNAVKDLSMKEPSVIYENMQLPDILKIFSKDDCLYYPVVNRQKKLRGIITIDGIKQIFLEKDIGDLVLAHDLMEPSIAEVDANTPIAEVREKLNQFDVDYLPVVNENFKLEGFIIRKQLNKYISTRLIELQKKADSLG